MLSFYKQFIFKGDLCFDIGANIGERTDYFLKLGAKVVAVEPQNTCYQLLKTKYKNKPVEVLKCAIGSNEREDELMICDESNECSSLSKDFVTAYSSISGFHWRSAEKIKVTTLENLCKQYGVPKFCKIDVEGYESEVLLGLKSKIKFICFEFNKPLLKDTIKSLEILDTIGNYQCNFIKYEYMNLVLNEWMPIKEFLKEMEHIITPDILTGEIILEFLD